MHLESTWAIFLNDVILLYVMSGSKWLLLFGTLAVSAVSNAQVTPERASISYTVSSSTGYYTPDYSSSPPWRGVVTERQGVTKQKVNGLDASISPSYSTTDGSAAANESISTISTESGTQFNFNVATSTTVVSPYNLAYDQNEALTLTGFVFTLSSRASFSTVFNYAVGHDGGLISFGLLDVTTGQTTVGTRLSGSGTYNFQTILEAGSYSWSLMVNQSSINSNFPGSSIYEGSGSSSAVGHSVIAAVPEPSALMGLSLPLAFLGLSRRRRKNVR